METGPMFIREQLPYQFGGVKLPAGTLAGLVQH
jgi:hypothetical protein